MKSIPYQVRETSESRPGVVWEDTSKPGWLTRLIDWVHTRKATTR